jgi:hypothetical protein
MDRIEVNVRERIVRPVDDVFDAVVEPKRMSKHAQPTASSRDYYAPLPPMCAGWHRGYQTGHCRESGDGDLPSGLTVLACASPTNRSSLPHCCGCFIVSGRACARDYHKAAWPCNLRLPATVGKSREGF